MEPPLLVQGGLAEAGAGWGGERAPAQKWSTRGEGESNSHPISLTHHSQINAFIYTHFRLRRSQFVARARERSRSSAWDEGGFARPQPQALLELFFEPVHSCKFEWREGVRSHPSVLFCPRANLIDLRVFLSQVSTQEDWPGLATS